jgi:hypothetical protein
MHLFPRFFLLVAAPLAFVAAVTAQTQQTGKAPTPAASTPPALFESSDRCQACHNGQKTPSGEDISFGRAWRTTLMANAARDPYWHAGVRRESTDFPAAQAVIEGECSKCHMPMARLEAHAVGRDGTVFANLPIGTHPTRSGRLAADGVSCTVCHQIAPEKLGMPDSFSGNLIVDSTTPWGSRRMYGPFEVDKGRTTIMHSATSFQPGQGTHVQSSEVCATCHTLFTRSLAPGAEPLPPMPEQVPYQEWERSSYKGTQSCQSCHMPVVKERVQASSVLGDSRDEVSRHSFLGGNFLMMRILGRNAKELGVTVAPEELERAADRTLEHLKAESASLAVERVERSGDRLIVEVAVENRAGHKLPTAYPSRRAWIYLDVRDATGRSIFESGAFRPDGSIVGNDSDETEGRYEPHYAEIDRSDQVQLYEAVMVDAKGAPTTGLLTGVRFVKDSRLLPKGFDKAAAPYEVAVQGTASSDPDFVGGGDKLRYIVSTAGAAGPFTVRSELRYQSIGFRWAENLRRYSSAEPQRFLRYYDAIASTTSAVLAEATATSR